MQQTGTWRKNVTAWNMKWGRQRNVWVQKLHYWSSNLHMLRGWQPSWLMKLVSWRQRNKKSCLKKNYWMRHSNIIAFVFGVTSAMFFEFIFLFLISQVYHVLSYHYLLCRQWWQINLYIYYIFLFFSTLRK